MSGLEILGAAAAGLQLADIIRQLCNRLLDKKEDAKGLIVLAGDVRNYCEQLRQWEHDASLSQIAQKSCIRLRTALEAIIEDLEGRNRKGIFARIFNPTKRSKQDYHTMLWHSLIEFNMYVLVENHRGLSNTNLNLDNLTLTTQALQTAMNIAQSGTQSVFATIQEGISALSANIQIAGNEVEECQETLRHLDTTHLPQLHSAVESEGNITRERIDKSSAPIFERLGNVENLLNTNETVTRIMTELLDEPKSLEWYGENGLEPDLRVWCLDTPSHTSEQTGLAGRYGGIELSSAPFKEPAETIFSRRDISHEVEETINMNRRRRLADIEPYVGLAKRDNDVHQLYEYMPSALVERLHDESMSEDALREALRISRTLGQEYRYSIIDQILTQRLYTVPELRRFEEMERAMIALHAEKFKVHLGFYLRWTLSHPNLGHLTRCMDHMFSVNLYITRY